MKKYLLPLILTLVLIFGVNCFAIAWDVDTATYANKFKYVGVQASAPFDVTFKPDGTRMYIVESNNARVYQYTLSIAWDVDTATYANKFKYVGSQELYPRGVAFKPDGTRMYTVGDKDKVYQYTLSIAWDVDTATYANKYKDVGSQDTYPYYVTFKPDGARMYITGYGNDKVYQYTLSTVWDVDTATYTNKFKYLGDQDSYPFDVVFKPDGSKMYIMGYGNDKVYQYTLSTVWDVDTATYTNKFKYVGSQEPVPRGVTFKPDGTRMYIVGSTNDTVYQYTLPVPPDPPTNVQATDGVYTDKVVITWTKSAGATGYQVYRNATPLGWLGDVATYNDTGANAPTITHGSITASDGSSTAHVALSNTGASTNNGTTYTYKVKARNAVGESGDSGTNTGYRGVGSLTYQWHRSAADSDASYSSISGATSSTYNDTGAPAPTITAGTASASDETSRDYVTLSIAGESANIGAGRYYKCYHTATGATPGYTGVNRGYRGVGSLTYQWQRSSGDSDADYSNVDGATTDPYNDTGAPVNGDGRYYKCIENATGATQQTTNADRGYRLFVPKSFFFGSNI